jgi:hypothetical protein
MRQYSTESCIEFWNKVDTNPLESRQYSTALPTKKAISNILFSLYFGKLLIISLIIY